LLGKLFKETGLVSAEALELGVKKSVPAKKQHLVESNMNAIKLGGSL
jgi:2-oxoglutarate ferredoxin oxidoreductase subunit gamma